MSEPMSDNPWEWDDEQSDRVFRMIGAELQRRAAAGQHLDLSGAARAVASELAPEADVDEDELGDAMADWLNDALWERRRPLVTMSWRSDHPGGGSLSALDAIEFGPDVYAITAWDEASDPSDEILALTESPTSDRVNDLIVDYLHSCMIPHRLTVPSTIGRDVVARILTSVLGSDSVLSPGWEPLVEAVGWSGPLETAEDRTRLLAKYLDEAVRFD